MTAICGCEQPGPSCMVRVAMSEPKRPCIICGDPTSCRTACGRDRHHHCAPYTQRPAADVPPAAPARQWLGEQVAAQTRAAKRGAGHASGTIQPVLRTELGELLTTAECSEAVELWNRHMRSIPYRGAHFTSISILNGSLKHPGIPTLPEMTPGSLDRVDRKQGADVWIKRSWLMWDQMHNAGAPGDVLAGYDVNAMYLSSAEIELGTGDPIHIADPDEAATARILKLPGYARIGLIDRLPWGMAPHVREGQWMATPLLAYLRDAGAEFVLTEALVWPEHRQWLGPHANLMRAARYALMEDGSPAALALLEIVKDVYTRMLGGLLSSGKYNPSPTLRPDWRAQIIATAQARMFRSLDKTRVDTRVGVAGVFVDAAWFVMPEGYNAPPGLVISTGREPDPDAEGRITGRAKNGKWKPQGRVSWSAELVDAWRGDHQTKLWEALGGRD